MWIPRVTFSRNLDILALQLPIQDFGFCDLEGCKVLDNETDEELGIVESVEEFPAQLTLSVKSNKTDKIFYVPFVEAFVVDVDIESKKIYINVIKGLID